MTEFIVTARNLALPKGVRFTYRSCYPIETDALYLLTINELLTVGRYYCDAAGCEWVVQPDLLIRVSEEFAVEIWGQVEPLVPDDALDQTIQSGLLIVTVAIVQVCDLVTPLIV